MKQADREMIALLEQIKAQPTGTTNTGDATAADVIIGKTFSSAALTNATGTLAVLGLRLSKTAVTEFDGGLFEVANTLNGKPRYRKRGGVGTGFNAFYNVQWSGTQWEIIDTSGPTVHYSSVENVATPDLVTAWTDDAAAGGTPLFVRVYAP